MDLHCIDKASHGTQQSTFNINLFYPQSQIIQSGVMKGGQAGGIQR